MIGRRVEVIDNNVPKLEAGDYCGPIGEGYYFFKTPNGFIGSIRKDTWTITENADKTISVFPSILLTYPKNNQGWHGYLENGIWREC